MPRLGLATTTRGALSITSYGADATIEVDPATTSEAGVMTATMAQQLAQLYTPPHVRVTNSANVSIVTATLTALTFDTEAYDVTACHSLVTNTGRLTVIRDGVHDVGCNITWASSSVTERGALIYKNGAVVASQLNQAGSSGDARTNLSLQITAVIGDYFECFVIHRVGVNINVLAVTDESPAFWYTWLCPT